jgi:hypothetical protein
MYGFSMQYLTGCIQKTAGDVCVEKSLSGTNDLILFLKMPTSRSQKLKKITQKSVL